MDPPRTLELPLAGPAGWDRQRTAAGRNHAAILQAARELFTEHAIDEVDVRQIAAAGGVGVGTVYRRFGDKASVIAELVGDQERQLQDDLLSGPPPVGPGAPAEVRLEAFLRRLCDLTERNLDLLYACATSAPRGRYRQGGYGSWHLHIAILLRDIDPTLDADWYADLLLAPLDPSFYRLYRREHGSAAETIAELVTDAARRLLAHPGDARRWG